MAHYFRQGTCLVSYPVLFLLSLTNLTSCPDMYQCYADVYGEEVVFN